MIVILALSNFLYSKKKFLWFVISLVSVYFVAISLSRAAYVSLAGGVFYLLSFLGKKDINKKFLTAIIFASLVFIFYAGMQKSMIASRQFYFQSLLGLINYPFGVGLGNFKFISLDVRNHIFGFSASAIYAEGIVFEFLSGLGILGIAFIYWFFKVTLKTILTKTKKPILEVAMLTVLSVNFLFDYTYFIPTMIWIWFTCLGIAQAKMKRR
jgi:hypothetical protein